MARRQLGTVLRHIQALIDRKNAEDSTDAELMLRYVQNRDEVAFTGWPCLSVLTKARLMPVRRAFVSTLRHGPISQFTMGTIIRDTRLTVEKFASFCKLAAICFIEQA